MTRKRRLFQHGLLGCWAAMFVALRKIARHGMGVQSCKKTTEWIVSLQQMATYSTAKKTWASPDRRFVWALFEIPLRSLQMVLVKIETPIKKLATSETGAPEIPERSHSKWFWYPQTLLRNQSTKRTSPPARRGPFLFLDLWAIRRRQAGDHDDLRGF